MPTQTISITQAKSLGLWPITNGYLESETWMSDNAIASLKSGNIPAAKVQISPTEHEVWRGGVATDVRVKSERPQREGEGRFQ